MPTRRPSGVVLPTASVQAMTTPTVKEQPARRGPRVPGRGVLDVGAVRRRRAAEEAARRPPHRPSGAITFRGDHGRAHWVSVSPAMPDTGAWTRLVVDTVARAGIWESATVEVGATPDGEDGRTEFRVSPEGDRRWLVVTVSPKAIERGVAYRTLGHELAHVVDELLQAAEQGEAAWERGFSSPHRQEAAEAVALAVEGQVQPGATSFTELLALVQQARRAAGRGRRDTR